MKKILYSLLFAIVFTAAFAQDNHLEFKGIPIDGDIHSFVEKMEKEDFKLISLMKDNVTCMKGNFVGERCDIYILSTPKTKKVCKVVVYLPESEIWTDLEREYSNYKELYTKKYGQPEKSYNFFSKPYYEGDGYEMQALRKKKCTYLVYWKKDNGAIMVSIASTQQISFGYEDKINMDAYSKEAEVESINDI